jgi:hypothetical protein
MVVVALASTGLVVSARIKFVNDHDEHFEAKDQEAEEDGDGDQRRCDPTKQEQTDLSGTYTGKANHGNGEPPQDATLTITGNNFTMASGSETHSGRITAVTTCGYIGVTMMMGDLTPPTPSPNPPAALPAVSLRAKKVGDKLWLTSVPGEKMQVSFTPTGGAKSKPKKKGDHQENRGRSGKDNALTGADWVVN